MPCYKQCGPNPMTEDFFIIATLEQSTVAQPPDSSSHGKTLFLFQRPSIDNNVAASISTRRTIRVPLDNVPDDYFVKKARHSDRETYWQVTYDVVLDVSNAKIAFWVEIEGKQYGREAVN
jgi:hypothetical protein